MTQVPQRLCARCVGPRDACLCPRATAPATAPAQDASALSLVRAYVERYHAKGLRAEHPRLVVAMMRDICGWPVRDASGGADIAHFSTEEAANAALVTLRREARAAGIDA